MLKIFEEGVNTQPNVYLYLVPGGTAIDHKIVGESDEIILVACDADGEKAVPLLKLTQKSWWLGWRSHGGTCEV